MFWRFASYFKVLAVEFVATTVQWRIGEMVDDVENTWISGFQRCKFSIQLDESNFGSSNLPMAYVRYNSPSLRSVIDGFLFAKSLQGDAKGETIVWCLVEIWKNAMFLLRGLLQWLLMIHWRCLTVTKDFALYWRKKFPVYIHAVHCVLHGQNLVVKMLGGELHVLKPSLPGQFMWALVSSVS